MHRRFELGSLLQVLLASAALSPAGCGGSSINESGGDPQGTGGTTTERLGVCNNPVTSDASGWIQCQGWFAHRESAGMCPSSVPRPPDSMIGCSDAECAGMPYGHCWPQPNSGVTTAPACIPGCVSDADCGANEVCYCENPVGRCIPADCTIDADCGPNAFCSTYMGPPIQTCVYHVEGAACQKETDACIGDECNCAMVAGERQCVQGLGGCGRPFLVEGAARHAPPERRSDWSAQDVAPAHLDELDPNVRAKLAAHFTLSGLLEHASVAAFARFSLELVALGAPAELVADAARAISDETRHARVCFALASAYGSAPVGPGPLSVEGCLEPPTLASVVKTVVLEGCIGETIAAAEARELAGTAADPVVREILEAIAADETRHAALAYRFVRWALERGGAELGELVRGTLAHELRGSRAELGPANERDDARTLSLGMPTAAFRASLRRDVLERVVRPCLGGLVAGADPMGPPTVRAA